MNLSIEPNYQKKIDDLRNQVGQYSSNVSSSSFLPSININSNFMYAGIPIVIFILLLLLSPGFIKYEFIDDKGQNSDKIHIKKLFIFTLVISIVIIVGIFAYKFKNKVPTI